MKRFVALAAENRQIARHLVTETLVCAVMNPQADAARVNAFGNWVLVGNTYVLYAPDGITPIHTFTLNDVNNPTSRV